MVRCPSFLPEPLRASGSLPSGDRHSDQVRTFSASSWLTLTGMMMLAQETLQLLSAPHPAQRRGWTAQDVVRSVHGYQRVLSGGHGRGLAVPRRAVVPASASDHHQGPGREAAGA
eukprot:3173083-Rhodomonas_salina.1